MFAALLLAEGVHAEVRGNVFHKTQGVTDHHGIWNQSANFGDSSTEWPSEITNDDWRETNEWKAE